jgi:hypothetical protein
MGKMVELDMCGHISEMVNDFYCLSTIIKNTRSKETSDGTHGMMRLQTNLSSAV